MAESLTVLIVDDNPDVRWVLEQFLRSEGFRVVAAANGRDALARLAESAVHLILVNAKLPDIEGIDLARRIRTEALSNVPMLMISGFFYSDDPILQDCLRTGLFHAFVAKPFLHEDLRLVIRQVFSSGGDSTPMESPP